MDPLLPAVVAVKVTCPAVWQGVKATATATAPLRKSWGRVHTAWGLVSRMHTAWASNRRRRGCRPECGGLGVGTSTPTHTHTHTTYMHTQIHTTHTHTHTHGVGLAWKVAASLTRSVAAGQGSYPDPTCCSRPRGVTVPPPLHAGNKASWGNGEASPHAHRPASPMRIWWTTNTYQHLIPHGHAQGRSFIAWLHATPPHWRSGAQRLVCRPGQRPTTRSAGRPAAAAARSASWRFPPAWSSCLWGKVAGDSQ